MQGWSHDDFSAVAGAFRRQLARSAGGAAVCVYHRGEPVVDLWGGVREGSEPWQEDTVAMCFSTTKGVASTALHVLADRGLVDYDEPVATYWPEFAAGGKEGVTVRHVLTHSAGLHRIRSLVDGGERMLDWDHMVSALAEAEPAYEPGTRHGYHALTYGWLVGEIVRRVSGVDFAQFVAEEIAGPLDCDGLYIGLPESERSRVAPLSPMGGLPQWPGPLRWIERRVGETMGKVVSAIPSPVNTRRLINALVPRGIEDTLYGEEILDASIPAVNGFFTARSLARMYAALAGGGELDGVRLMGESTVKEMGEVNGRGFDQVLVVPMDWRLGYHRVFTTRGPVPSAFGHFGFGGSGGWADPSRDLSVAMVCCRGTGSPVGDLRIMELGAMAVRSADRRSDSGADNSTRVRPTPA